MDQSLYMYFTRSETSSQWMLACDACVRPWLQLLKVASFGSLVLLIACQWIFYNVLMLLLILANKIFIHSCCCSCSHKQFFGAFQIVSPFEDTCVEIYTVDGDKYSKVLDEYLSLPFETYKYTSPYLKDLSGYYINSSKPISVYAGHACAFVPEGTFFCDHIIEQIPPVSELGKLHIVPPITGRDPNAGYVQIQSHTHTHTQYTRVQKKLKVTISDCISIAFI